MLSHAQSPARLGLTSPPKPPPPQQPPPQPQSTTAATTTTAAATTTTTTANLLSLLPPLPRSQSLLSLLSHLTTKLFLLSPSPSFRLNPPSFLPNSSAPNPAPNPTSIKETLSLLSSIQSQLFVSVSELQEILDLHDAAAVHSRSLSAVSATSRSFSLSLLPPYSLLRSLLHDYSSHSPSGRADRTDRVALSDVISYAHRISYTTFAPPEFGAGTAPLRGALPPAPQEEQMRASQLYAFADLDVGLPKEAKAEGEGAERVGVGLDDAFRVLDDVSSMIGNLKVPEGWRPGMPVELTEEVKRSIPVPPPGWKPGMPVALPGEGMGVVRRTGVEVAAAQQQQQQQQGNNVVSNNNNIGKEQATISVRPVDLELPDNFDDSSDYSSEEGSSDDED